MYEQEVDRPDSSTHDKGERMQDRLPASQKILTERTVGAMVGKYKANRRGDIFYADRGLADIFEYESPEEMVTESFLARYGRSPTHTSEDPANESDHRKRLHRSGREGGDVQGRGERVHSEAVFA